jgi:Spy/CpxP family protein refolding chaperone
MTKGSWFWGSRTIVAALLVAPLALAGCRGHHRGEMTEAELGERMEDIAEYALDHVDASEQQTAQVNAVLRAAAPDLVAFRREHRELAAKLRAELAKDKIDRAQVEMLRQEGLDLADRASARASQALLDAADELQPEQRRKLAEKWAKHQR